jgi:hypothetical protein
MLYIVSAKAPAPEGSLGSSKRTASEALERAELYEAGGLRNVRIKTGDGCSYSPGEFMIEKCHDHQAMSPETRAARRQLYLIGAVLVGLTALASVLPVMR